MKQLASAVATFISEAIDSHVQIAVKARKVAARYLKPNPMSL